MTSLNISLPRSTGLYIDTRVHNGAFSTPSEFIRTLIREDEKRHAVHSRLAKLLDGTIARSGTSDLSETDWTSLQNLLQDYFGVRTTPRTQSARWKRNSTRAAK
jgi:antitoxin ParD1/3/4